VRPCCCDVYLKTCRPQVAEGCHGSSNAHVIRGQDEAFNMVTSRSPEEELQRQLQAAFLKFFWPYTAGGVVWLTVGLTPALVAAFPGLRQGLLEWADAAGTPVTLAVLARIVILESYVAKPDGLFVLQCLFSALNLTLGVLLAWLRPGNHAAQLLAFGMVGTAAIFNLQAHAAWEVLPVLGILHEPFHMIAGLAYLYALALFPDGKIFLDWPRPHWFAKRLLLLYNLLFLVALPIAGLVFAFITDGEPVGLVLFFGVLIPIAGISSQALRARYAATPEERQQSRVLVWALALAFSLALLFAALTLLTGGFPYPIGVDRPLLELRRLVFLIFPSLFAVIPITLFVVILRYRLWDIDIIIRRTLVYGALTAIVVGIYVLVVGGMSVLLQMRSDLLFSAIAVVLIVLLFRPFHRGIQRGVNRLVPIVPPPVAEVQADTAPPPPASSRAIRSAANESQPDTRLRALPRFPLLRRLQVGINRLVPLTANPVVEAQSLSPQASVASRPAASDHKEHIPPPATQDKPQPGTRLRGPRLFVARAAWIVIAGLALVLYIALVPINFSNIVDDWDVIDSAPAINTFVSVQSYALYILTLRYIVALVFIVSAAVIFWRKSDDWMALLVSLTFVAIPTMLDYGGYTETWSIYPSPWAESLKFIENFFNVLGSLVLVAFFYLFPDGRFVPRWMRLPAAISAALLPLFGFALSFKIDVYLVWGLLILTLLGSLLIAVLGQIYRYRRISDPAQRQQTKWVVFGLAGVPLWAAIELTVGGLLERLGYPSLHRVLAIHLEIIFLTLIPLTTSFSILRYRLWDIDIIIRRTLTYGMLTGIVVGVYALVVGGLSTMLQTQNDLLFSIVALGLIALLFQPLHRRLQVSVNRLVPLAANLVVEEQRVSPQAPVASQATPLDHEGRTLAPPVPTEPLPGTRMRGYSLLFARTAWVLLTGLTLVLFAGGVRHRLLFAPAVVVLRLIPDYWALLAVAVGVPVMVCSIAAMILVWRKSDDWLALLVAFAMVAYVVNVLLMITAPTTTTLPLIYADQPALRVLFGAVRELGLGAALVLFYMFPDGRFVPRQAHWLIAIWTIWAVVASILHFPSFSDYTWFPIWLLVGMSAMIYRYGEVSSQIQRQQIKWVLFGLIAPLLALIIISLLAFPWEALRADKSANWEHYVISVGIPIMACSLMGLPLSIAVATLRYRLWDIDVIIRRTLIYGALTAGVVGLYVLVVGGLTALLPMQGNLLPAIITLALAALLARPLYRRLQSAVARLVPVAPHPIAETQAFAPPSPPAPSRATLPDTDKPQPNRRLRGPWLVAARAAWLVAAALNVALYITHRSDFIEMFVPWSVFRLGSHPNLGQISFFVINSLAGPPTLLLACYTVAAVIVWRRSDDWMAIFASLTLMMYGAAIFSVEFPIRHWSMMLVQSIGWGCLLIFFLVFPDGRFVPRWTRWLAALWGVYTLFWLIFPTITPRRLLGGDFNPFGILLPCFGVGTLAQIYRYVRVATPIQRQQTKWVVFGFTSAFLGIVGTLAIWTLSVSDSELAWLAGLGILIVSMALIPVSIAVAVLRYRLWDIDIIIRRTLIYGALIGALALVYFGSVALLQALAQALTGPQSSLVIVATTLAIATLFNPVRRRIQEFIDRRFYREKVDFRQAFTDFAREVRTIIELPELLRALVNRTTDLLHIAHGAVFLRAEDGTFQLAEARSLQPEAGVELPINAEMLDRLQQGGPIPRPNDQRFPLLVPLIALETGGQNSTDLHPRLIGVLALGPRLSDQRYSHEDQELLTGLADQAGTAIHVAQLIEEKRAEAQRREETERQLEARRNSPIGRAEAAAQALLANPQTALIELHHLADAAGQNPESTQLLEHLPRALGVIDHHAASLLIGFADGYSYLFFGRSEPELLAVGLRTLIGHLELAAKDEGRRMNEGNSSFGTEGAAEALALYQLCAQALDAASIAEITELLPRLPEPEGPEVGEDRQPGDFLADLQRALAKLHPVAAALRAYERVDTTQDRLAYLAGAVERLSRLDRLARTELGGADRPIVQRIAEQWLAITTGAMSELQTRAQLVCRLLTRHTWQDDMVALVLAIRNDGRGAALNLSVSLPPAPECTLLDEAAQLDRLATGEEVQITLRLRPHLADGASQFRIRCLVRYADPRGPDQVEHFADEVQLLTAEVAFQFIPNPYIVGTPLQGGSPLFFGRQDLLAFIKENLQAAHRNNLVLIGQRRTGKTSLLKQLPARLGGDYLPVYLDGQSLGLDPGLPNFFLALATEIAFALDDRGFDIVPPEMSDFAESPAAAFERGFLPQVRAAIGGRHLLLLLDEFEELEGAVRRGSLEPSIFGFLRHVVQHTANLSVIFCGTHRLEELAADYWSVLFNISLYRHVGFLEREEADRLIEDPVATYGMRYDGLALEKIWRVTAGHPYFLQLLCHSLVNRHNRSERSYVTIADVNAALDEILAAGEAHFMYLWAESNEDERLALAALSRAMPLTGRATPAQVEDYLADHGVTIERRAVAAALHRLGLRDILTPADDGDSTLGEAYRWKLGLLGLWIEKYRSLSRVVGEVRS